MGTHAAKSFPLGDKMKLTIKILMGLLTVVGIGAVVITSRKVGQQKLYNEFGEPIMPTHPTGRYKKSQSTQGNKPWLDVRLPKDVVPDTYNLHLNIDMTNDNYTGVVTITVNVTKATHYILLHTVDLFVDKVLVKNAVGRKVTVVATTKYSLNEYLIIEMVSPLVVGTQYTITCAFNAPMRTDLNGLFIINKGDSKMAATFLSPISSRKFFPCFDEPSFKARFTFSITHDIKYNALSNMDVWTKTTSRKLTTTSFKQTLPMSTYILGVLLADDSYTFIEKRTEAGLKVRVWDFKNQSNTNTYGLNKTVDLLNYYEKKFFEIPFPMVDKLDIAILPEYTPGAMENWGLMFFRNFNKESFHLMVHEVAHQWFGNLATMDFWDIAWIKEGFAQYLGTIVGDALQPERKYLTNMFDSQQKAQPMDSYSSSHPVVPNITTPTDIRNVYDSIVYYKGENVVHILRTFVGLQNFRLGMKKFLQEYQYKNAKQDDLFRVMGEVSGKDVKSFMDPWLLQMGYPVLMVERINSTHIEVEQERFSLDAPNTAIKPSRFNYQWPVIVTYRQFNGTRNEQRIMTGKKEILEVPANTILNPNHLQYYRIRYGPSMKVDLKTRLTLNNQLFSIKDRVGIISDQYFNLMARKLTLIQVMKFLDFLKYEGNSEPWIQATKMWMKVNDLIKGDSSLQREWTSSILKPYIDVAVNKFSGTKEIANMACKLNNSKVVTAARNSRLTNLTERELQAQCCAILHDTSTEQKFWHQLHAKYLENPIKNVDLLEYLSCTKNTTQISRLLEYTMNLTYTKSDDATWFLDRMMQNDVVRDMSWSFIQKRWPDYMSRYSNNIFMINYLINAIIPRFTTQAELDQVETFFNNNTLGTGSQAVQQAISTIKMNIALGRYLKKDIDKNKFTNPFLVSRVVGRLRAAANRQRNSRFA